MKKNIFLRALLKQYNYTKIRRNEVVEGRINNFLLVCVQVNINIVGRIVRKLGIGVFLLAMTNVYLLCAHTLFPSFFAWSISYFPSKAYFSPSPGEAVPWRYIPRSKSISCRGNMNVIFLCFGSHFSELARTDVNKHCSVPMVCYINI